MLTQPSVVCIFSAGRTMQQHMDIHLAGREGVPFEHQSRQCGMCQGLLCESDLDRLGWLRHLWSGAQNDYTMNCMHSTRLHHPKVKLDHCFHFFSFVTTGLQTLLHTFCCPVFDTVATVCLKKKPVLQLTMKRMQMWEALSWDSHHCGNALAVNRPKCPTGTAGISILVHFNFVVMVSPSWICTEKLSHPSQAFCSWNFATEQCVFRNDSKFGDTEE